MNPALSGEGSAVAEQAEKELLTYLTLGEPTHPEVEVLIAKYRTACEAFLLNDFVAAATKNTESRLWAAHRQVNNRYRSRLAKFSNVEKKKRPVERRKLEKHYVAFIKSSMRFYRGYIQRLASHFESPKEVLEVAHRFHLDTLSAEPAIKTSPQEAQFILDSCHETLVRLGDLSRYRETELQTKKRNWAPAVGYYDLAIAIKPSSGAPHNQLAAIALADESHIMALYHLYRALSAHVHHARARENLDIELKKILNQKNKDQLLPQSPNQQPGDVLQASFLYFHARLHGGVRFSEHEELENEFLTNLSKLKESPLDGLLDKFTLINIAAQQLANSEATENPSRVQAFLFFLRSNVNIFSALLRILIRELRQVIAVDDEYGNVASPEEMVDRIGATFRGILPCLRHYSSWLVSNVRILTTVENHELVGVQITKFWRMYAVALTLLERTFPRAELPEADYLLEEDEDTIAFAPFSNMRRSRRYLRVDGETTVKPRRCDQGVQRHHPSVEMLVRVRGLLEDGIALAAGQGDTIEASIPLLVFDDRRFELREEGVGVLPPESNDKKTLHASSRSSDSAIPEDVHRAEEKAKPLRHPAHNIVDACGSVSPSGSSIIVAKQQMVDRLTATEASESHLPTPQLPQIPPEDCGPSPIEGKSGASIWSSSSAPRTSSPSPSRPHTRHKHIARPVGSNSTAAAQSSTTRLQEALLAQQRELEMQEPSSVRDLSTTSTSPPQPSTSARRHLGPGLGQVMSPGITSPFASLPSDPSTMTTATATFPGYDVPRQVQERAAAVWSDGSDPAP